MALPFDQDEGISHPFSVGENNHAMTANPVPDNTPYADIAARDADTAFQVTENINKGVRVDLPDIEIFVLLSVGPTVWSPGIFGQSFNTWAEVLAGGNTSGGTNPIISSGDKLLVTDNMSVGGVTDPAASSSIDLKSTTAAFLFNRLTTTQRDALTALNGMGIFNVTLGQFQGYDGVWKSISGDVAGPASSTDNALARFNLTTGKLIQNSLAILDDLGELSGLTRLSVVGKTILGAVSGDPAALLDLISTTLGFYPPRMTTTQRDLIPSPPIGLQIDNITTNSLERFDGAVWQNMASSGDVFGPGSSVDKSMPGFSGVTGKLIFDPDVAKIDIPGISLNPTKSLYQQVYPSSDKETLSLSCQDQLDRSPFGNDMNLEGDALIADGAGQFGKGLRLNGISGTLGRVVDDVSLQFTDALTVECRIFANADSSFQTFISKIRATVGNGWSFSWSNNTLRIVFRKNNNAEFSDNQNLGTLVPNTWHHVAFTLLDSTLRLITYIDGLEVDSRIATNGYTDSADDLLIGSRFLSGIPQIAALFNGDITNVHIYNRVLSSEEIRTEYLR